LVYVALHVTEENRITNDTVHKDLKYVGFCLFDGTMQEILKRVAKNMCQFRIYHDQKDTFD